MSKRIIAIGKVLQGGELQYFHTSPDKIEPSMVISIPSEGNARFVTASPVDSNLMGLSDPRPLDSYEPGTDNHAVALAHMVTIRQMFDGAGFSLSAPGREKLDQFFTAWVYGDGLNSDIVNFLDVTPAPKLLKIWALPVYYNEDGRIGLDKFFNCVFESGHPTEAAAALVEYLNG